MRNAIAEYQLHEMPAGKQSVAAEYEDAHGFFEGLSAIQSKGKWGFIDTSGAIVIEPRFDAVSSFFNGMASIVMDKKYGYIDKAGKIVVEPTYDYGHFYLGELAGVTFHPNQGDGVGTGYIDRKGRIIRAPRPEVIHGP